VHGDYGSVGVSSAGPILVVDDNDETRDVLQRVLQIKGYVTAEARSGPDALRWLRDGNPTRLILLDINMPGMDGWAVHAELKSDPALAAIPVIVFSGVDGAGRIEPEDIVAYVRKGVDPDLLLSLIERTCRQGPPVTGSRSPLRS
jgi:CheY-like chemotaxis protein